METNTYYYAGIDIGSTTVKLVLLNEAGEMVWGEYRRHCAHTQETLAEMMREARKKLGACRVKVRMTGSGAISLAEALRVGFVQEVVAVAEALQKAAPQTDVAIELGGEDAKIIYFTGGLEERMNGVCAGGTGSFIDQMAALLKTDAPGLNELAKRYHELYPIAARCGVFAKSDIQPLINEGAAREDLAASIFQAVVNQTISGLACGKPIRGHVAFLVGPLHFLTELRQAFVRTLHLTGGNGDCAGKFAPFCGDGRGDGGAFGRRGRSCADGQPARTPRTRRHADLRLEAPAAAVPQSGGICGVQPPPRTGEGAARRFGNVFRQVLSGH